MIRQPSRPATAYCWYLLAAAIPFGIVVVNYAMHGKALAFADIGNDTFFSFYPLQMEVSRMMHALDFSLWSFHLGLGGFMGNLFDPAWLLTGWLPLDWQLGARLPTFIIRGLLAGGFMVAYLKEIGFERRYAVLGGLCYVFCDYGMINAQWEIIHGTEFLQFPLYLFLLERFLSGKHPAAAIVAGIVIGLGNSFGLFEFAFLSVLYLVVRHTVVFRRPWRETLRQLAGFLGYFLIGLMIVAPLLLPALIHFAESPRVGGSGAEFINLFLNSFHLNDRTTISAEVAGFLGKNLLGVGNDYHGWANYLEGPSFYIGLLPLLCVTQLAVRHASRKEQALFWIALAGIGAYILSPFFRYATFGFGHITFRHSTLWISAVVLVLGLLGLRRAIKSGVDLFALFIGWAAVLAIAGGGLLIAPDSFDAAYAHRVMALASAYALVLIVCSRVTVARQFLVATLALMCVLEFSLQSTPSLTMRDNVSLDGTSDWGSYNDGVDALAAIRMHDGSNDFYRIMKTKPSVFLDDPLAQNYYGTTSYYFHNVGITRFIDHMAIPRVTPSPNYVSAPVCCRAVANLDAVRYVMAPRDASPPWPGLMPMAAGDKWSVYRNPDALPFGFLVQSVTGEGDADGMPVEQRRAITSSRAIVADAAQVRAQLARLDVQNGAGGSTHEARIRVVGGHSIAGTIDASQASILVLSMPLDRGWRAKLDGQTTDLLRVDYGLTGIIVPPGKHHLTMHYRPQGRTAGLGLSGLGLLLAWYLPRRRRRNGGAGTSN